MGKLPYYAYFGSSIVYSVPQLHDEMEIYLSLNHNGSFLVQDTRYPLETGSLIIIRPFEIHYGAGKKDRMQKSYMISMLYAFLLVSLKRCPHRKLI